MLNLVKSSISYSSWCIINYTLNCLKLLRIESITFIVSTIEEFNESNIVLGKNLTRLDVDDCKYWITDLPWETTKFIFNTVEDKNHDLVKLPLIYIPTLREVMFYNYYVENGWLAEFLLLNPQLTALNIDISNIDQFSLNMLAKSSNLTNLSMQCWGVETLNNQILKVPNLFSIKKLNIEHLCELSCDFINNIILSCSNLNTLNYDLRVYSNCKTVMRSFYTNTTPKLQNLKYMNIDLGFEELMDFDLKYFSSVEHLEIGVLNLVIRDLELPTYPTRLKKLAIIYRNQYFKVEDLKKFFDKFVNWRCIFIEEKIICSKLK